MTVMLENEHIRVGINEHGAELSELILKKQAQIIFGAGMQNIGADMRPCCSQRSEN